MTNILLPPRDREALLLKTRANHRLTAPFTQFDTASFDDWQLSDFWIDKYGERRYYTTIENHYRVRARLFMTNPDDYEEDGL